MNKILRIQLIPTQMLPPPGNFFQILHSGSTFFGHLVNTSFIASCILMGTSSLRTGILAYLLESIPHSFCWNLALWWS